MEEERKEKSIFNHFEGSLSCVVICIISSIWIKEVGDTHSFASITLIALSKRIRKLIYNLPVCYVMRFWQSSVEGMAVSNLWAPSRVCVLAWPVHRINGQNRRRHIKALCITIGILPDGGRPSPSQKRVIGQAEMTLLRHWCVMTLQPLHA